MNALSTTKHFPVSERADIETVSKFLAEMLLSGRRPVATVEYAKKIRTLTQNRSLHLFLTQLAEGLNDAGLDMRVVLKPEVDIPWNKDTCKEYLWRPLQKVIAGEESTADCSTVDYTPIYDVLDRHMGQKHGFRIPDWPCIDTQMGAASA